jgi:preprotein translocase subunit SecD
MGKTKAILTNWRVIVLIAAVILAVIAIHPAPWADGVVIKAVAKNSSASLAGIVNPKSTDQPLSKERVLAINGNQVHTVKEYYDFLANVTINQTLQVRTTLRTYSVKVQPNIIIIPLNKTISQVVPTTITVNTTINGTIVPVNQTVNKTILVNATEQKVLGHKDIGLTVDEVPLTNLRKGLDLQGGTRVILKPAEEVSQDQLGLIVDSLTQRLNVFGLSDIVVTTVSGDAFGRGSSLILVEIAGASTQEVSELVQQQGKFEASIGNTTVFRGGNNDVTYVCRTAECSGLDPQRGCGRIDTGWTCGYRFQISLSPTAAQRQADATSTLSIVGTGTNRYLSEPLNLYLDNDLVRTLNIAADLKGHAATDIVISGSGAGISQDEAITNALQDMKVLQTVLITGSLPVKLEIAKIDSISPILGTKFIANALLVGVISALAVTVILGIVYRKPRIIIPIILTSLFEVLITLGIAATIRWNLDLASIAGIIIAIGTGVNDQIIITDEAFKRENTSSVGWKERIKRAFFIIIAGFFTDFVAMLALWFFGAGLLKGFAVTTIIALIVGTFITRPAYAAVVNRIIED